MGRRAKKAPVVTKKRPTLAKRFKCPFCANEAVVECKMDFRAGVGSLSCRLCAASYQMPIHHLHEPVDVFSEWLDDCEAAANQQRGGPGAGADHDDDLAAMPRYNEEDDDIEDDDDIPEPALEVKKKAKKMKKKKAKKSDGGSSKKKQSYTDLGLDDSDEDSD